MKDSLIKLNKDFNLVDHTIENAKQYIKDWKLEQEEEFIEFFSDYNLENVLPDDFSAVEFDVRRIGYDILLNQEDVEEIFVVLWLNIFDVEDNHETTICSYYCYYDMNGNIIDNYID